MKFKEIKPGMVIHCPKEEDARALLEYLDSLGYVWFGSKLNLKCRPALMQEGYFGIYNNKEVICECGIINSGITEFSDLIEPDDHPATTEDINWSYDPTKGYFDGKPVTDSPINPPTDSSMTAVEVLEWFHKNYENADVMKECFNYDFSNALIFMLNYISEKDVVDKITAYEAEKKKPKPVEVEEGWHCEISKINSIWNEAQVVMQDGLWGVDQKTATDEAAERARQYAIENGVDAYFRVCGVCRVKEGEE